jgi:DNA-binding winged helix-turn-helix (wHTH) protein
MRAAVSRALTMIQNRRSSAGEKKSLRMNIDESRPALCSGRRPARQYRFGDLALDPACRRVTRGGHDIPLSPLTFDVLRVLVESAPDVVHFADLAERAWKLRFVAQHTVTQRIKLLRRSLGDTGTSSRYIESVRGRGYRLKIAVHSRHPANLAYASYANRAACEWYARAEDAFRLQAPEQGFAYIDRALAIEPDFAAALGLKAVGLVRSLINADGAAPATAQRRAHVETVALRLAERALHLDSSIVLAWVARAMLHTLHWRWGDAADAYRRAAESGALDPAALEPYAVFHLFRDDPSGALKIAKEMQDLDPTNAMAFWIEGKALSCEERYAEALRAYRDALRLSPTQVLLQRCVGDTETRLGHKREAEAAYRATEQLLYGHPSRGVWLPSLAYGYAMLALDQDSARLTSEYGILYRHAGAGDRVLTALSCGDEAGAIDGLRTALAGAEAGEPDPGVWALIELRSNYLGDHRLRRPQLRTLLTRLGAALGR